MIHKKLLVISLLYLSLLGCTHQPLKTAIHIPNDAQELNAAGGNYPHTSTVDIQPPGLS